MDPTCVVVASGIDPLQLDIQVKKKKKQTKNKKKKTPPEEQKTQWEIEYKRNYHFIWCEVFVCLLPARP